MRGKTDIPGKTTINIKNPVFSPILVFLCLGLIAAAGAAPRRVSPTDLNKDMRKLWEDHITWTRIYIVDTLSELPARKATANRLLANQTEIGDALKPFYGNAAGNKLTALLKSHILIAAEVVDAAKAGDHLKQNAATERWYENSDAIADFLGGVNSENWPPAGMRIMLREHLDATIMEVAAGLKKDWVGEIKAYDKLHGQILEMADMISGGILKQFPNKFKK
jgi:hypothetical protein